jgi:hypothetical protein
LNEACNQTFREARDWSEEKPMQFVIDERQRRWVAILDDSQRLRLLMACAAFRSSAMKI